MTLADLEKARAALPEDDSLPAATTRAELADLQRHRAELDRRLVQARDALAALAALGSDEADRKWYDELTAWRATLGDQLLSIKSPIREPKVMGRSINLTLSIKCIDFGPQRALKESGYGLTTLRLGELMCAAGYEPEGADPDRNYAGVMPWHGSLSEVERRIADRAAQRAKAQAALEEALLDDDARAKRDAESNARRDELNSRPVRKTRGDGSQYDKYPDGRRVEVS